MDRTTMVLPFHGMGYVDRTAADLASIMYPVVCSEPTYWDNMQETNAGTVKISRHNQLILFQKLPEEENSVSVTPQEPVPEAMQRYAFL
jgi:hypothetical protein